MSKLDPIDDWYTEAEHRIARESNGQFLREWPHHRVTAWFFRAGYEAGHRDGLAEAAGDAVDAAYEQVKDRALR